VVLDEAYVEFCPQSSAIELLDQFDHLVILRTLSKAWAAAGLRCGSVLANPGVIALLRRVMAPYPLAAPVVNRVRQLLDPAISDRQQDMIRQILVNKARLVSHLEGLPYIRNIWPGAANFVLVRLNDAEDLLAFCAANGIAVRGFSSEPLLRDCIRISVGTTDEIDALAAIMTAWGEQR
jgi:histidinol-phosphate aminotransferase